MDLSQIEKQDLRAFLVTVYGAQAKSWSINGSVFNHTYQMLHESRKCSDLMELVPRPMAPGQAPIKYITKNVRGILLRKLKDNKQHYKVCIGTSALKAKTKIYMAAMGL
ncbi:hypothetical protein ACOYR1_07570 [Thalassotalea piscium]